MPTKTIESRHNTAFKLLKDLASGGRARRQHNAAWLEGARLCDSFVHSCHETFSGTQGLDGQSAEVSAPILVVSSESRLDAIDRAIVKACASTWLLDAKLFAEISQVETSIGWGMVVPVRASILQGQTSGDVVVLDRIQDPGNAGTILRSAAASGVAEVWSISGTVDLWSPKVLRAAMGAHFVLNAVEQLATDAVILRAQETGHALLATSNSVAAVSLYADSLRLDQPIAWVFGQEGDGVSQELLRRSQVVVIPQSNKVESLNVAAAASVCLFETMRRKQRSLR